MQFVWFIKPPVVCPILQGTGIPFILGHIDPAGQKLHAASPFNEYVPSEHNPLIYSVVSQ